MKIWLRHKRSSIFSFEETEPSAQRFIWKSEKNKWNRIFIWIDSRKILSIEQFARIYAKEGFEFSQAAKISIFCYNFSKLFSSVCVVYSGFEFTFVASDTKNSHRLKSGRLIKKYLEFEPRILDVAKVIRQWAEWCRLDRADEVSFKADIISK